MAELRPENEDREWSGEWILDNEDKRVNIPERMNNTDTSLVIRWRLDQVASI